MVEVEPSTPAVGQNGTVSLVELPVADDKGKESLACAQTQLGDSFDHLALLVIDLEHIFKQWHINYTKPDSYTCAGLIVKAYQQAGVDLFPDKDADEIAMGDVAKLLPAR